MKRETFTDDVKRNHRRSPGPEVLKEGDGEGSKMPLLTQSQEKNIKVKRTGLWRGTIKLRRAGQHYALGG